MTKTMMTGVALVALLAASPVSAAETQTRTNIQTRNDTGAYVAYSADEETVTKKEVERSLEKAGNAIERTAKKAVNALDGKAQTNVGLTISDANIAQNASAEYMIGKPVMNSAGERVGSVHDLIIAQNGRIDSLIVADGGQMSVGDKKAAFDFSVVNGRDANGSVLTSITEEQINQAKAFSYDVNAKADNQTQVKSASQTSVRDVIGAKITGPEDKSIGSVKDIAIDGNQASKVILAHDQFLGLGGKKAAIAYEDLSVSQNESGRPALSLTAQQAAQLSGNHNNM